VQIAEVKKRLTSRGSDSSFNRVLNSSFSCALLTCGVVLTSAYMLSRKDDLMRQAIVCSSSALQEESALLTWSWDGTTMPEPEHRSSMLSTWCTNAH